MTRLPEIDGALRIAVRGAAQVICAVVQKGVQTEGKEGYAPGSEDLTTNVDGAADKAYRRGLSYVGIDMVSEDGSRQEQEARANRPRIVFDAVDGTRSLSRGRLDQVGTMVAAVEREHVTSAYIAQVTTGVMIGFAPKGPVVHYAGGSGGGTQVLPQNQLAKAALQNLPVITRGNLQKYSKHLARLLRPGQVFKGVQPANGSFGLGFFGFWQGKAAAHVLPASFYETPWDNTPVYGICEQLGVVAYRVDRGELERHDLTLPLKTRPGTEAILVHGVLARQFEAAVARVM